MAYPLSGGGAWYPDSGNAPSTAYSGTFIPEIWSGKLVEKFYDATVLAAIANTDYEGEIRNQGDAVKIRTKPTLAVNNYVAGQTLAYERPSSNVIDLLIDKGKYFNAILDDVHEIQADVDMLSAWADDASEQMEKVKLADELTDETCPNCGQQLAIKTGRFGKFLACTGYPECKFTRSYQKKTGVLCPQCGGDLVERRSRKGRIFYGCSNYPTCNFAAFARPLREPCPQCGGLMTEFRDKQAKCTKCGHVGKLAEE